MSQNSRHEIHLIQRSYANILTPGCCPPDSWMLEETCPTKTFSSPISIKMIALLLILIGGTVTIVGNYFFMLKHTKYELNPYYSYLGFSIFLLSTGVFLLFKNISFKSNLFVKIRNVISTYSYGIYLSHVLVLSALSRYAGIHWMFINPYVGIIFTSICCFVISLGIVYLINKLPYGKHISG